MHAFLLLIAHLQLGFLEIADDLDAFDLEPAKPFLQRTLDFAFRGVKLVFSHSSLSLPFGLIPPPRALCIPFSSRFIGIQSHHFVVLRALLIRRLV